MTDIADLLTSRRLVVTAGPGGVGKTTTAAALGLAAARLGRKTVVMTVDPARRLAEALGLDVDAIEVLGASAPDEAAADANDRPHRVDGAGADGGELWTLMLDSSATFDRLITTQAGSAERAERILNNPVYQAISRSLAGAQEYMAIERLHELATSGEWDLVIVDTPPSRHALDLLEAPDRLTAFLGHPVYRALTVGQRAFARVTNAAASAFLWAVKRLAGPQIVEDTLEFFRSITTLEGGLRERAEAVSARLREDSTAFVVITSPRAEAIGEARHLLDGLERGGFPFGALVANLLHPVPPELPDDGTLDPPWSDALRDQVEWHEELTRLAASEREQLDTLVRSALIDRRGDAPIVELALRDDDVHDLAGLADFADDVIEAGSA
ncbi:MAG: ArsA-related P-loop ATPase [Actinomycetota bacterium]